MNREQNNLSLLAKLKLIQARFYELLGSSVDKAGVMEVRTDNFKPVYEKIKEFFNTEEWKLTHPEEELRTAFLYEIHAEKLEIENDEAGNLVYKSKRKFLSIKDEQFVDVRIVHLKGFIGITLVCTIPRQSILNKYKYINDGVINELRSFLSSFYTIENFSIEYIL